MTRTSEDLSDLVKSAWDRTWEYVRLQGERRPVSGEQGPCSLSLSESDFVYHLARHMGDLLGDHSWLHLEYSLGGNRRVDVGLLDPSRLVGEPPAPVKGGWPWPLDYGVEVKAVLPSKHVNYSEQAVRADIEKLEGDMARGRIVAGAVCVVDCRPGTSPDLALDPQDTRLRVHIRRNFNLFDRP